MFLRNRSFVLGLLHLANIHKICVYLIRCVYFEVWQGDKKLIIGVWWRVKGWGSAYPRYKSMRPSGAWMNIVLDSRSTFTITWSMIGIRISLSPSMI